MIPVAVQMRRRHRHDKARRAEPALRAVKINHRLLYRVQRAIRPGNPLDGAHRLGGQLRQQQDAGIQRPGPAMIADHHRAGPAIALVAALFGALQLAHLAQPVQKRYRGRCLGHCHGLSVQKKRDIHH